jgi:serine/threonine-protein kinase
MKLAELQPRLEAVTSIDVGVAYQVFRGQTGSEDLDQFLIFLRDRGYLSTEGFQELYGIGSTVEVTSFSLTLASPSGDVSRAFAALQAGATGAAAEPAESSIADAEEPAIALQNRKTAKYSVLGFVGEGGMGQIHVAKDLSLRRKVALKQLKEEAAKMEEAVTRFVNEAQVTAQLDHPNIVPVYSLEIGEEMQFAYSMKLVQGKTLKKLIDETKDLYASGEPIDEEHDENARLGHFLRLCDALAFAHSKGVIHRDLKPENIMIGRFNELYVMDWGLARLLDQPAGEASRQDAEGDRVSGVWGEEDGSGLKSERTLMGTVLGTPRYMSPEQAKAENDQLDGRSDIYTLGLILYELASLKKAIPGKMVLETLTNAAKAVKLPLVHVSPRVTLADDLRAIIDKATAPKPSNRYATVKELSDDINRYLRGDAVSARRDTVVQKLGRAMARNRQAAVFGTATLVLGVAALSGGWVLYNRQLAAQQREEATKEERDHAERESRFVIDVAQKSQELNAKLLQIQAIVEGISQGATQALGYGTETADPIYFEEAFVGAEARPPGLVQSAHYGGPVSLDFPVWAVAPGASKEALLPPIRRLNAIRAALRDSCLARHTQGGAGAADVVQKGGPILWCYLGLAEGAVAIYPGTGSVPEGYDPRTRPWYTLSVGKPGSNFGNPYIDKLRGERVLPCSASLQGPAGQLLGVAGVSVRFDYLIEALSPKELSGAVRETFLTNENAQVIIRSSGAGVRTGAGELHDVMDLEPLPLAEVAQDIREKKRRGKRLIEGPDGPALVAYNRIDVLGWYHVVVAQVSELYKP